MTKFYKTETQEAFNDLMKVLKKMGYETFCGDAWHIHGWQTVVMVGDCHITAIHIEYFETSEWCFDELIEWTVEPTKKVEVSKEFDEWVQKAKKEVCGGELWKEWCIWQINKMGFSHWLEEPITRKRIQDDFYSHPIWTKEVDKNKELHTRAILDGYTVKKEKLYEIPLPDALNTAKNQQYLSYDKKANHFVCAAKADNLMQQFTELELENMVPKFYHELAVEVD